MDSDRVFPTPAEERLRAYFSRLSDSRPLRALTKQEWIQRRGEVREKLVSALGLDPLPDRIALEPRNGGVLERTGYRVERVYWQTWPRVWAAGLLYRPVSSEEAKSPALLVPGANAEAAASDAFFLDLVHQGYAVLIQERWSFTDLSRGIVPATLNVWAGLRALDYLTGLPDVERDRIGILGARGSAVEAALILALDDRPRAGILPLSDLRAAVGAGQVPSLSRVSSLNELLALPSPRALLLFGDEAPGTEAVGEPRAIYRLWQQPDRLAHLGVSSPTGEGLGLACEWLSRELRGRRESEELPARAPEREPPAAEFAGEPPAEDRGLEGIREWFEKRVVAQPPQLESRPSRRSYQERTRADLRNLLGDPEPTTLDPEWGAEAGGARAVVFRSERDVRIPALWTPAEGAGPRPALVACSARGKSAALRSPLVREFSRAGWSILAPDVRFCGEMRPRSDVEPQALSWGRPEVGMATDDLRACVQWLFEREEVDFRNILLLGEGLDGIPALLAAALDDRVAGAIADCGGTTYRDGGELPVLPNVLRTADVPQIASLVAPRPLWLYHVPPERVGFSSRRYYDWTRRTYQSLGDEEALKMSPDAVPDPETVLAWLEPRLKRQAKRRSF